MSRGTTAPSGGASPLPTGLISRLRRLILGKARDVGDPSIHRKISLVAFLAWVGLGVDGMTSSAYGPEEAFRSLGRHHYLAPFLALAAAGTVFVISYAYARIIEHFPAGGGGYVVATRLLGRRAGVVSGCALLVDYVLTISVSIAGGGDAIFSMLPIAFHKYKLAAEFGAILLLVLLNLRGVKESVTPLVPIFLVFFAAHVVLILGAIGFNLGQVPAIVSDARVGWQEGVAGAGVWGMILLFLRAYSLGAGTYTGIEAVSNGLGIMREPRVETGKRTMMYMACSLAFLAGGLLLAYLLAGVGPVQGMTLNAVLADQFAGRFAPAGVPLGAWFVMITLCSEGVLLFLAAQTGFIDGPRVMANMAADRWLPRRFVSLSDRLSMQNGVLVMGITAMLTLAYARGHIGILVVMYSINVFVTFTLSQMGMTRFWIRHRTEHPRWKRHIFIHIVGLVLCLSILIVMLIEKLTEGGWVTVGITLLCIAGCAGIQRHYRNTARRIEEADKVFAEARFPIRTAQTRPFDPSKPTAVVLVARYGGLGIHPFLTIFRLFPETFHNVVFAAVGVVDSSLFTAPEGPRAIDQRTRATLDRYVDLAGRLGIPARSACCLGTDVVEELSRLCVNLAREYPRAVVFAGELCFEDPKWYHRLLHNDIAYAVQRRIRFAGLPMVILPYVLRKERPALPSGNT